MTKMDFEITRDGVTYRDAIVLHEGHNLSDAEIAAMKESRFAAWRAFVAEQSKLPPEPEPTPEWEEM
jgi:hypothetical protein